jgi:hypothetical protein
MVSIYFSFVQVCDELHSNVPRIVELSLLFKLFYVNGQKAKALVAHEEEEAAAAVSKAVRKVLVHSAVRLATIDRAVLERIWANRK